MKGRLHFDHVGYLYEYSGVCSLELTCTKRRWVQSMSEVDIGIGVSWGGTGRAHGYTNEHLPTRIDKFKQGLTIRITSDTGGGNNVKRNEQWPA